MIADFGFDMVSRQGREGFAEDRVLKSRRRGEAERAEGFSEHYG